MSRGAAQEQRKIPKQRAMWREVAGRHFYPPTAPPIFFLLLNLFYFKLFFLSVWDKLARWTGRQLGKPLGLAHRIVSR